MSDGDNGEAKLAAAGLAGGPDWQQQEWPDRQQQEWPDWQEQEEWPDLQQQEPMEK